MDGGASLDRSLGSPRLHSELKWAAIGVAVLLRERLPPLFRPRVKAPKPARHPVVREQELPRAPALLGRYLPHRIGTTATALLLLGRPRLGTVPAGPVAEF